MSNITKDQVLNNLKEVKQYIAEAESKKEEKKINITIKNRWTGSIIFESTKTTYKDAVVEAVKNGANLREADLREADLREADLCGANLYKTNLREANLCGANLRGANLREADLCRADLCGANLREADLCGANLREADLREADLCGAEFMYVKFGGKGASTKIKKSQINDFFTALGINVED